MAYRPGSVVTAGDTASTTRVIGRPIGAVADDIHVLLFYIENLSKTPVLSPGTWTKIPTACGESNSFETHVYWSRQGIETGDITITWDGVSIWNSAIVAAYTGRSNIGDPQDATGTFNNATGTALTATGLTTANANADIIAVGSNIAGTTHGWDVIAERADFGGQSIADVSQGSAGATGDKTATLGASTDWAAGLIALRAAETPPTPPAYPDASIWRRQPGGRLTATNLFRKSAVDASQLVATDFFEEPTGGGGDVTVGLTGVSATGAVGAVVVARSAGVTGVSGTGAAGSVAPSLTLTISGTAATGAAGTVTQSRTAALTGASGTGAVGALAPSRTLALTGASATGAVGTVAVSVGGDLTLALTGVAGAGSAGNLSPATSCGLTGTAATGTVGTLTLSRAAALTGVAGTGSAGNAAVQADAALPPQEVVATLFLMRDAPLAVFVLNTMTVETIVMQTAPPATFAINAGSVATTYVRTNICATEKL